jgi:7-carboxy-7-deazaguanine synthase
VAYKVKEMFYTLQGEGAHAGRPAVFCRFTGCNLWTGREKDRPKAICQFCDTDFVGTDGEGGGVFEDAKSLANAIRGKWGNIHPRVKPYVVCTGGEPLLQIDNEFIDALHEEGFEIAVETNGTIEVPQGIDWICMSPKAGSETIVTKGNELKLVFPQQGAEPEKYEEFSFENFYLQPMWDLKDEKITERNTQLTLKYCLANPQWKMSIQTHKILGIP